MNRERRLCVAVLLCLVAPTAAVAAGDESRWVGTWSAARQEVNTWIRGSGRFDGVIDLDVTTRDRQNPARLSVAVDGGDHLHPGPEGYKIMAASVDLPLFRN